MVDVLLFYHITPTYKTQYLQCRPMFFLFGIATDKYCTYGMTQCYGATMHIDLFSWRSQFPKIQCKHRLDKYRYLFC
jgi:hypothetical protein